MDQQMVRMVLAALLSLSTITAYAQGSSTASISGVVVDLDRAVISYADVVITNMATAETFNLVTLGQGVFSLPSLFTGTYTVTISLTGFKTVLLDNVVVNAGVPANVRATLELGTLTEQVIVQSTAELIQTQSATVTTTLDTREVASLPLSSRSAFDFVVFLPGTSTAGGQRESLINGLPQGTINITLDGVNIQDNTNRSTDGFFAIVRRALMRSKRSVSTRPGLGRHRHGSVADSFRHQVGDERLSWLGYSYRSDDLNANTWF